MSRPLLCLLSLMWCVGAGAGTGDAAPRAARYAADGTLVVPADYREWVFLSAGLDMSYTPGSASHSMFDNVFVDPAAWAAFKAGGRWPEGTVLALEARGATGQGSINRRGSFQSGEPMAVEFHVRDSVRFKGGWAFFEAVDATRTKLVAQPADCYSCHESHGAVDTTFVQFYPTARVIATRLGTFLGDR